MAQSVKDFGIYRNVAIAKDGTILAGHGVVEAALLVGVKQIPVKRMPWKPNDPRALKLLTLDNTVTRLARDDDDLLESILRELSQADQLLGTGYEADEVQALGDDLEEFDPDAEARMTESSFEGRWLVAFLVNTKQKTQLDALVEEVGLPGERYSDTLGRLALAGFLRPAELPVSQAA